MFGIFINEISNSWMHSQYNVNDDITKEKRFSFNVKNSFKFIFTKMSFRLEFLLSKKFAMWIFILFTIEKINKKRKRNRKDVQLIDIFCRKEYIFIKTENFISIFQSVEIFNWKKKRKKILIFVVIKMYSRLLSLFSVYTQRFYLFVTWMVLHFFFSLM